MQYTHMPSMCRLQALLQDFQRTTDQLVKDKLQEQRVGIVPYPNHTLPLGTAL